MNPSLLYPLIGALLCTASAWIFFYLVFLTLWYWPWLVWVYAILFASIIFFSLRRAAREQRRFP